MTRTTAGVFHRLLPRSAILCATGPVQPKCAVEAGPEHGDAVERCRFSMWRQRSSVHCEQLVAKVNSERCQRPSAKDGRDGQNGVRRFTSSIQQPKTLPRQEHCKSEVWPEDQSISEISRHDGSHAETSTHRDGGHCEASTFGSRAFSQNRMGSIGIKLAATFRAVASRQAVQGVATCLAEGRRMRRLHR